MPEKLSGAIAFVAPTSGFWQIWILDCTTGQCRCVTESKEDKRSPAWSPDGKSITYRTSNGSLQSFHITTKETRTIAPVAGFLMDPRISPSGRRIAFARFEPDPPDNTDLFVAPVEGGAVTKITNSPDLEYAPAWAPDESRIAYVSGRGLKKHLLHVMNADGTNKKKIQDLPSDDMTPAWSPDGLSVVFSSSRTGDYEIWRVRSDGLNAEQLTTSPGLDTSPCYAPDGSRIVFCSNRGGKLRLWVMNPDGSECSPLTMEGLDARDPFWWQSRSNPPPSNTTENAEPVRKAGQP